MGRRRVPGNGTPTQTVVYGPDRWALGLAGSMAIATNTFSPMAAGVHDPGGTPRGFSGDRGYGVSRMGGRTLPKQSYGTIAHPVAEAQNLRLGIGAGVAGQPGLPQSGGDSPSQALGWMSLGQLGALGLGQ